MLENDNSLNQKRIEFVKGLVIRKNLQKKKMAANVL